MNTMPGGKTYFQDEDPPETYDKEALRIRYKAVFEQDRARRVDDNGYVKHTLFDERFREMGSILVHVSEKQDLEDVMFWKIWKHELSELKKKEEKLQKEVQKDEEDSKKAAENQAKIQKTNKANAVPAFNYSDLLLAADRAKKTSYGKQQQSPSLEAALRDRGYRTVPKLKNINKKMNDLALKFPNFKEAIDSLSIDLAIAASAKPAAFYVSPQLLNGAPGIGKTAFVEALAQSFGLPYLKLSASGLQGSFALSGSDSHYGNTHPGYLFETLAKHDSIVQIILLDEIDKLTTRSEYAVLPALLELLEPVSARTYKDVSVNVSMDVSKLIVIGTSNDISSIDSALLSRFAVRNVKTPEREEKVEIAVQMHEKMNKESGKKLEIDKDALRSIIGDSMDLREIRKMVRAAFGRALMSKSDISVPEPFYKKEAKRIPIGFINS